LRSRIYVVLRATQGTREGPLLWARTVAFSTRMEQSLREPGHRRAKTYGDDPFIAARGTSVVSNVSLTMVLLTWLALGVVPAWKKAQRGPEATWTPASIKISKHMVTAAFKAELFEVIRDSYVCLLKRNLISLKELRTLAGRTAHTASLQFGWLPLVRALWGSLLESSPCGAPQGLEWVKQIMIPRATSRNRIRPGGGDDADPGRQPLGSWSNSFS